ncbi:MAG: aspartate aminotransferase family protein [Desulfobacterales bacterium]|nr:MAG: aspartate aminotransferase family protein [Desulfobacterales bacterium]UCD90690.1 MAG: aspartate aminotransferase family protein [Desulfobacterales bacterium]
MSRKESVAKYNIKIEETYRQRTLKSREIITNASRYVPDGDYRVSIWFEPYPTVMERGDGYYLYDVDGNEYLDFSNNWTSMVLGNNHPKVVEAIQQQAPLGSAMAAPHTSAYEWAQLICDRIPSVEKVRFCTSGTEAVMFAVRAARAFTGKDKILKMEGNYHGSYDPMEMTTGWRKLPLGLPKSVEKDVLVTPFNDKETTERIIKENKDELAAVIVEGILGAAGMIPPEDDYLKYLHSVASQNGLLLIIDEVISFRLATGGAQEIYNVQPDLTVLGKSIGGGLPTGAFGGREDVMAVYSPKQKRPAHHAGTFVATPIAVMAGIASLKELTAETLARINSLGWSLANGLQGVLDELKIKAQIKGYGSLQQIHFTPEPVSTASTAYFTMDRDVLRLFHLAMMNKGLFIGSRGFFSITTPMTEAEIETAIEATAACLSELKPLIEEIAPKLVG